MTWHLECGRVEIVKQLPCSLANGPQRIRKERTPERLALLCIGCTSVVQCERTVVLWSVEMRNFSAAECGKAIMGNLRNVPQLIFRKLPLDSFPHSAKYSHPSTGQCKHFANVRWGLGYRLARKWSKWQNCKFGPLAPHFLWHFIVPLEVYNAVNSHVSSSYQSQKHRKWNFAQLLGYQSTHHMVSSSHGQLVTHASHHTVNSS